MKKSLENGEASKKLSTSPPWKQYLAQKYIDSSPEQPPDKAQKQEEERMQLDTSQITKRAERAKYEPTSRDNKHRIERLDSPITKNQNRWETTTIR